MLDLLLQVWHSTVVHEQQKLAQGPYQVVWWDLFAQNQNNEWVQNRDRKQAGYINKTLNVATPLKQAVIHVNMQKKHAWNYFPTFFENGRNKSI